MKAVVIHPPHTLEIEERESEAPAAGEVAVRVGAGGICGSDMHYYLHGGFGTVRVREPMVLGHEIAGTVAALGPGVTGLAVGDRVAVNPSLPCGVCRFCTAGLPNHCEEMRFFGSAMRTPHVQGGFRDWLVCDAARCVIGRRAPVAALALAEPFSVALHAVGRAGDVRGRRVLVTGCGPIGVLAVAAARLAGAGEIIATDLVEAAMEHARVLGADRVVRPEELASYAVGRGSLDVMVECSGNERAFRAGLETLGPRGVCVQVGLGGDVALPQNMVVAREIAVLGSFRFHEEFERAVGLIDGGEVELESVITATVPVGEARAGFELARDRAVSMKVQLGF